MYWSKTFIPTLKEVPQEAESVGHQLMLRAGLIRMLMSGVYSYLPLGLMVLRNIENVIRQEMNAAGASELLLPALQPLDLWLKSGRDAAMGEVMIRFTDRRGRKLCLGPTHEEVITDLVRAHVSSYRHLPVVLYQIQSKFRDEMRPRFGLVRGCEFIMKDAYSFDRDQTGLDKNYQRMLEAYKNIFQRCGLDFMVVEADAGVMGGSVSHEFMVPADFGEDAVLQCAQCREAYPFKEEKELVCPKCGAILKKINTLEVGHIFQLGTKYSGSLGAQFTDVDGLMKPIIMGCYGIGVSRLISAIIEQNHDAQGIVWPQKIAPFNVLILPLDPQEAKVFEKAKELYGLLQAEGVNVLFDDRDERAGVKFKDADLSGIPLRIVLGREFIKNDTIEIKRRKDGFSLAVRDSEVLSTIKGLISGSIAGGIDEKRA